MWADHSKHQETCENQAEEDTYQHSEGYKWAEAEWAEPWHHEVMVPLVKPKNINNRHDNRPHPYLMRIVVTSPTHHIIIISRLGLII